MPSAGEVRVTFSADARQFVRAAQEAARATQQFEQNTVGAFQRTQRQGAQATEALVRTTTDAFTRINSMGSKAFQGLEAAIQGAGVAMAGVLTPALIGGYKRFTTIENATASLTRQLGDAAKAGAFMQKILATVQGTPFNLDQFADAASHLVAMNVEAAKVPNIMVAIGEAAANAPGEANANLQQLTASFVALATSGRLTGEIIQRLEMAGVNARQMLANALGKPLDAINRNVVDLGVSSEQAMDIFTKGILEGGEGLKSLKGSMADLRKNLEGATGGFKAALDRLGARFFAALQGDAKNLAGTIQSMSEILDALGPKIDRALKPLGEGLRKFQAFGGLKDIFHKVQNGLEGVTGAAPAAGLAMGAAAGGMLSFAGSLPLINKFVPPVVGKIALIPLALGGLLAGTAKGRAALESFFSKMRVLAQQAIPPLVGAFSKLAEAASEFAVNALPAIVEGFMAVVPVIQGFSAAVSGVMSVLGPVIGTLSAIGQPVLTFVTALVLANKTLGFFRAQTAAAIAASQGYIAKLQARAGAQKAEQVATDATTAAINRQTAAKRAAAGAVGFGAGIPGGVSGPGFAAGKGLEETAKKAGLATRAVQGFGSGLSKVSAVLGGPWGIALGASIFLLSRHQAALTAASEHGREFLESLTGNVDMTSLESVEANTRNLGENYRNVSIQVDKANAELEENGQLVGNLGQKLPWLQKAINGVEQAWGRMFGNEDVKRADEAKATKEALESELRARAPVIAGLQREEDQRKLNAQAAEIEAAAIEKATNAKERQARAVSDLTSVFQKAYARALQETQEAERKRFQESLKVTRSMYAYAAAIENVTKAEEQYIKFLNEGTLTTENIARNAERLVEAYVRHRRATSDAAITESEMNNIRTEAYQQVVQLTRAEIEARRQRELSTMSMIASFNELKDSVITLEKLNEQVDEAVNHLVPDPSVVGGRVSAVKKHIGSLVDEFAKRTKDNAETLSKFVDNVNFLAKNGQEAFAAALVQMGIEGAGLAAEAVKRMESGEGLGELGNVMEQAAMAAKKKFDDAATKWGPNFAGMASGAVEQLAPVIQDDLVEAFEKGIADLEPSFALFERYLNEGIVEYKAHMDTVGGIFDAGYKTVATILDNMGPEALGLAQKIAAEIRTGIWPVGKNVEDAMVWAKDHHLLPKLEEFKNAGADEMKKAGEEMAEALREGLRPLDEYLAEAKRKIDELMNAQPPPEDQGILGWLQRTGHKIVDWLSSKVEPAIRKAKELIGLSPGEENVRLPPGTVINGPRGRFVPPTGHFGGYVTTGAIQRFHSGGMPGPGERDIRTQTGEYILSRKDVRNFGGPMNVAAAARRGGVVGPTTNTAVVNNHFHGPVVGSGMDEVTDAVRTGLSRTQFRNVDIGLKGTRRR